MRGAGDPSRVLCILCRPHLPQALCVSQNHLSVGLSRTSGVHGAQGGDTASSAVFSETDEPYLREFSVKESAPGVD